MEHFILREILILIDLRTDSLCETVLGGHCIFQSYTRIIDLWIVGRSDESLLNLNLGSEMSISGYNVAATWTNFNERPSNLHFIRGQNATHDSLICGTNVLLV